MTDMTDRKASSKERLLSAVSRIHDCLRHDSEENDCRSCDLFDELQIAALAIIHDLENLESGMVEISDSVEGWADRRCKSDV